MTAATRTRTRRHQGEAGRPRSRWRRWLAATAALAALVLGYLAVSLFQVWSTGRADEAREVDAIVVLGAAQYDGRPSPQLAARLDEVVRLWPRGLAPNVVVTGGRQPGDRFTEAEASARYLVDRGVPDGAILYENEGATTYDSLARVAELLATRDQSTVLLVTDPFHSLRSRLIAAEVGLTAYVAPTSTSVIGGARNLGLHLKEAAGVALGRIIGFERLDAWVG